MLRARDGVSDAVRHCDMDSKFRTVPGDLSRAGVPLPPPERPKPRTGRPRVPDRVVLVGILYRVWTGCRWKALPSEFRSGSPSQDEGWIGCR